jgi:DMSO/TMAO reductase YedYZ molybdopterin-dependent catalytic subunit
MKKATKIALVIFALLIVASIPLYYFTRPDSTQPPDTLQIKGKVANTANLTLSQLETYPAVTMEVTVNSGGHPEGNGVFNYTGVLLKDLLNQAQISGSAVSVYIQASDGYGTTLTIQDAQNENTFIAYQKMGASLTLLRNGGEGPFRLIINSDEYAQRWVRGVVSIEVS